MRRPALGYRQRVQRGAVRWALVLNRAVRWALVLNLLLALGALFASLLLLRRVWP